MNRGHWPGLLAAAAMVVTGACKKGPDYTPPPVAEFEQFRDSTTTAESIANLTWWELFADTTLQALIATAVFYGLGFVLGELARRLVEENVRAEWNRRKAGNSES